MRLYALLLASCFAAPPQITSAIHVTGLSLSGDVLVITGSGLSGINSATINNATAAFSSETDNAARVQIPGGVSQGTLRLTPPTGASALVTFSLTTGPRGDPGPDGAAITNYTATEPLLVSGQTLQLACASNEAMQNRGGHFVCTQTPTISAGTGLQLNGNTLQVAVGTSSTTVAASPHSHFGQAWVSASPQPTLTVHNTTGTAVEGQNHLPREGSNNRAAVRGLSYAASDAIGVLGVSTDVAGGVGVMGISAGTASRGVYAYGNAAFSGAASMYGRSTDPSGVAVDARAPVGGVALRTIGASHFDATASLPIAYAVGAAGTESFAQCAAQEIAIGGGCAGSDIITYSAPSTKAACDSNTITAPPLRLGVRGQAPGFEGYCCRSGSNIVAQAVCLNVGVP